MVVATELPKSKGSVDLCSAEAQFTPSPEALNLQVLVKGQRFSRP